MKSLNERERIEFWPWESSDSVMKVRSFRAKCFKIGLVQVPRSLSLYPTLTVQSLLGPLKPRVLTACFHSGGIQSRLSFCCSAGPCWSVHKPDNLTVMCVLAIALLQLRSWVCSGSARHHTSESQQRVLGKWCNKMKVSKGLFTGGVVSSQSCSLEISHWSDISSTVLLKCPPIHRLLVVNSTSSFSLFDWMP